MIIVTGMIAWIIVLIIFGIALGGQWFCDPPTMADALDDIAVRTKKRQPTIYLGYQVFFIKLGTTTIAITIAIVHVLTGFVEGAPSLKELRAKSPTPDLALFGIRIHAAIVPAIILVISIFIFWKFYDLTPEKIVANRAKLKELGL
jgi:Na+/melibiose symporter-like transporter